MGRVSCQKMPKMAKNSPKLLKLQFEQFILSIGHPLRKFLKLYSDSVIFFLFLKKKWRFYDEFEDRPIFLNMVLWAAILKVAISGISMRESPGFFFHYLDPNGGSGAGIGELACMPPPATILTGLCATKLVFR